jgi:hypothetical protein
LAKWLLTAFLVAGGTGNSLGVAADQTRLARDRDDAVASCESVSEVRLRLRPEKTLDGHVVVLTLTNDSTKPIVVDRNLVLGVDVRVIAVTGDRHNTLSRCVKDVSTRGWTAEMWKQRFVTLPPGQSFSRRLDLRGGIAQFSYGRGYGGPVVFEVVGPGVETLYALDTAESPWKDPAQTWILTASCGVNFDAIVPMERYVGLPERVAELASVAGFRAINLQSGEELSEMQFNTLWGEEERRSEDKKAGRESVELGLNLALQQGGNGPVVVLTVTNVSNKPITLDRELVFDFRINVESEGRDLLEPVRDVSVKHWSAKKWKERMIVLGPSESLSRRVELRAGVRNVEYVGGLPSSTEEEEAARSPTGEYVFRITAPERPRSDNEPALLTVHCGLPRGRLILAEYRGLNGPVIALPHLSGFRAIDLKTGKELTYEQYLGVKAAKPR